MVESTIINYIVHNDQSSRMPLHVIVASSNESFSVHSSSLSSTGNCIHIYNLMSSSTWWPMAVCSLHINRIWSFFRPYLLTLWDSGKSKGLWTYFDPKIVSLAFFSHISNSYIILKFLSSSHGNLPIITNHIKENRLRIYTSICFITL